jgi:hypothetical protein
MVSNAPLIMLAVTASIVVLVARAGRLATRRRFNSNDMTAPRAGCKDYFMTRTLSKV